MNDQPTDYSSIDAFHVGRRRKPNFTDHEVINIIDQYDMYKELLHSREASKSVIAQKQAIWKQITETLNATYPQVERTVEDVRRKWKKLQSEAKREVTAYRTAQSNGSTTSVSNKQMNLYNRILSICRAPISSSSHFVHHAAVAAAIHHQQALQLQSNMNNGNNNNNHEITFNERSSDRADSPSSDLANGVSGQLDSAGDESASLLGNDDNSPSPATSLQPTSLSSFLTPQQTHITMKMTSNGQISKRTLDKQRKYLKSSQNQQFINSTKSYGQQQNSLRFESLIKRKRTLELASQRLIYDKERLLIERKNLDIKLAANECENERISIEKRRNEIAIQKFQCELSITSNGTNNHLSDQDDHDDHNSLDDISDINE
ncbi:unnamed protein product [Rotaria sordida]|uniref:Myb/SANT-like DNA-binding domain-containing protein n=1 Tax=Rotaria sordida TaxID=392033 RepID=A0A814Y9U9_9BILA|nr:unnamed protein product [Rotaria sordida]CAF1141448.1 unnamed protein product [Rotaria sordida]CAF1226391.1 unnamed protein product [Rotaria sordida]CAF1269423.1 unnamed protein product [Rotaria sordida]CAF1270082.1 unnamed protein product [Rotaria sordida]